MPEADLLKTTGKSLVGASTQSQDKTVNQGTESAGNDQMTQSAQYDLTPLGKGSTDKARILEVQVRLDELGFDPNGIDGSYGNGTADAVTAFQSANGITPTGEADSVTLKKLYELKPERSTGALSEKFEAPGGITSVGYDTNGGTSYGRYQLSSKLGSFGGFVDFLKASSAADLATQFEGAKPYDTGCKTGTCPSLWKKLAAEDPRIKNLEKTYVTAKYYTGPLEKITDEDCKNLILSYQTLKDVFWSTSVQHGQNGAPGYMMNCYKKGMTEEQFIEAVYAWRKEHTKNSKYKTSLWNRYDAEKATALSMLALEKSGKIPTSGLGAVTLPQDGSQDVQVIDTPAPAPQTDTDATNTTSEVSTSAAQTDAAAQNSQAQQTIPETVYTVVRGDSLWKIANQFNVKGGYKKLAEYNGINVNAVIHVGDKLRIPGTGSTAAPATDPVKVDPVVETPAVSETKEEKQEEKQEVKDPDAPVMGTQTPSNPEEKQEKPKESVATGYIETTDDAINAIQKAHPNGINVAFYGGYKTNDSKGYYGYSGDGDNEFTAQANNGAKLGQTVGSNLTLGKAIMANSYESLKSLSAELISTIQTRYAAAKPKDAPESPDHLKIKDLSLYYHGYQSGLNIPGTDITTKNVKDYVTTIRDGALDSVNVQLFACTAAKGEGSFAETMAKELGGGAQVYGHTTAAHCTENTSARVFNAEGEATDMVDVLFPESWKQSEAKRIWGSGYTDAAYAQLNSDLNSYYKSCCDNWRSAERKAFMALYPETVGVDYYKNFSINGLLMFTEPEEMSLKLQNAWRNWALTNHQDYSKFGTLADSFNNTNPVSAEEIAEKAAALISGIIDSGKTSIQKVDKHSEDAGSSEGTGGSENIDVAEKKDEKTSDKVDAEKKDEAAVKILDDADVKDALSWYTKQDYSEDFIKQIEGVVKATPDGKLDANDIQAIAVWQKSKNLTADGEFGSKSIAASGLTIPVKPFSIPKQSEVRKNTSVYGKPGQVKLTKITPPYQMYYAGSKVGSISVNEHIADRVQNILKEALDHYGEEGIKKYHLDQYSGCYNDRGISGGTAKSMHAWAVAIDIDGANNPDRKDVNGTDPLAQPEVSAFWDIVEKYGGYSLGRQSNRDWMHFQFASWD